MATNGDETPTRVGIGLIARGGRFLIRRRPPLPGSPMPGLWEFPGGKCEPGEPPDRACARECAEEVGLVVRVLALRRVAAHRYPHGLVELYYYDCALADASAEPDPATGFVWAEGSDLPRLAFPEANGPILEALSGGQGGAGAGNRGTA